MNRDELEKLSKKIPKYWNYKLVDKIYRDVINGDAIMVDRLNLERFKTLLDSMIVKTIQINTKESLNQLEHLEFMKQFCDRMLKILQINKIQADLLTMETLESFREIRKKDLEIKKLNKIDNFGK